MLIDELIDVVNEHDQVIGVVNRSELLDKYVYTRIVLSFIVNHEGKHAVLRRTADKLCSPLHLALVGGMVQSGETYEQAAKREIAEEANINVDEHIFKFLGLHAPHEGWQPSHGGIFKSIYEVKIDNSLLDYNEEDFCELLWLTPQELVKKKESDKCATGLIWLFERYYL